MYVATVFIWLTVLTLLAPAIWVAWWLIADFGERASQSPHTIYTVETPARYRPAA